MVNYPAPTFPAGTMLTVKRLGARDIHGDRAPGTPHQVGPCDLKWMSSEENHVEGEQIRISANVTAPIGSDVVPTDQIILPDGRECFIDGEVIPLAPNPFTGWATGVRFTITHVR